MKHLPNRLRDNHGETLLETLVATLIFTLGSIIMLTMISSSAKINSAVRKADDKFYIDMVIAEKAQFVENSTPVSSVSFRFQDAYAPALEDTASVYICGDPASGLYAYYPVEGGSGS